MRPPIIKTSPTDERPAGATADGLVQAVYSKLHSLAEQLLRHERNGHTLQATALVHEAYLRLAKHDGAGCANRQQFVRLAARAMRQILVNHERDRARIKRGGGMQRVAVDSIELVDLQTDVDLIVLDDAMARLERIDPRKVEIVQLRFFGGLTVEETSRVIGVSVAQVKRDWTLAKAWLSRELEASAG